ncbi:hypothetical protein SUGI_0827100 [Cryptomeria japonica]|nr:hypothetical protein SUGI_0827100 [Cryptomeria japonica]
MCQCFFLYENGGIYIKLGQYIGRFEMLDSSGLCRSDEDFNVEQSVPHLHIHKFVMCPQKNLESFPMKCFLEFNPIPLASASLAQVHAARTLMARKLLSKFQRRHLTNTIANNTATLELITNILHRCFLFPAFDYRWLTNELRGSLPKELDFTYEVDSLCVVIEMVKVQH